MLLKRDIVFTKPIDHIYFIYKAYQPAYRDLQEELGSKITFIENYSAANLRKIRQKAEESGNKETMLVIDDNQSMLQKICFHDYVIKFIVAVENDKLLAELLLVSRHLHLSILIILHALLARSKELLFLIDNISFLILFKLGVQSNRLSLLNSRLYPMHKNFLLSVFRLLEKETSHPYIGLCLLGTVGCHFQCFSYLLGEQSFATFVPSNMVEENNEFE